MLDRSPFAGTGHRRPSPEFLLVFSSRRLTERHLHELGRCRPTARDPQPSSCALRERPCSARSCARSRCPRSRRAGRRRGPRCPPARTRQGGGPSRAMWGRSIRHETRYGTGSTVQRLGMPSRLRPPTCARPGRYGSPDRDRLRRADLRPSPPHTRVWPHENCATQRPGPGSQIFLRGSRPEGADGPEPAVRRVPARLDRRTRRPA